MLLDFTNDNITEYIRKESVFITNAVSFVLKNKETLSLCISSLSEKQLETALSLMNILNYNLESLENLQLSLENLKKVNKENLKFKLTEYNTAFTATFHQLFNTTSSIENIIQNLLNKNTSEQPIPESKKELEDNSTLLISEKENLVYLPYKKKNIENILMVSEKYSTPEDVIKDIYTVSLSKYTNSASARFREGFNLMRKKECASFFKSVDLGLELFSRYDLNPAVITACQNPDELDIYLDCLETNELEKFNIFNIKYEVNPTIIKQKDNFISQV